jgi:flavodoxin
MKILVVYYSLEGNTRLAAETIARKAGADVQELKPLKEIPLSGFGRYFQGGRRAFFKQKPALKQQDRKPEDYDLIFVGTPVWAWTFAPPLCTFFSQHDFTGKAAAPFCCHGGGPGATLDKMKKAMTGAWFPGEIELRDPKDHETQSQLEALEKWTASVLEKMLL